MRKSEGMAASPDAIPVFATAARSAILAPMPPLEINATQPWLIAPDGNVTEIIRRVAVINLALHGIEADFDARARRNLRTLENADAFAPAIAASLS